MPHRSLPPARLSAAEIRHDWNSDGNDVDTDNASITFSISGSELSITSGGVLTFESTGWLSHLLNGDGGDGANSSADIAVTVTNVNDNSPVFTSGAAFSVAENQTSVSQS